MRFRILMICLNLLTFSLQVSSQWVVINEVLVGPSANPNDFSASATTNANSLYSTDPDMQPPYNREYIELYNTNPCDTADLSCYTLGSNTFSSLSGDNWGAFTFPQGTKIPPLGFLIVGGNNAPVPVLDFNTTQYRQTSFNVQYLTGFPLRWFLRDQWGWIALYNPQGAPVDAVYWNASPGNATSLYQESEYQNPIVNTMGCNGTVTLPAASAIPGITYVGNVLPGTMTSFQRVQDGSPTWHATPVALTARGPNGIPIGPATLAFNIVPEHCNKNDGAITVLITGGGTGPYTKYWNGSVTPGGFTISNLAAGTYTIEVRDAYECLITYDTIVVPADAGPVINVVSVNDELCSGKNGSVITNITSGLPPYSIIWNTTPVITTGTLLNMAGGTYVMDVIDAAGCTASDTITIGHHKEPMIQMQLLSPDSCGYGVGKAAALVSGDYHPYQYLWNTSPAQTDSLVANLPAGNYQVTVTDGVCTTMAQINIPLIPGPVAAFKADPEVVYVQNGLVQFTDLSQGPLINWSWEFGDGNSASQQNPSHLFTSLGTYPVKLTVTDPIGCEGSVIRPVLVKDLTSAYFPNAFTPDGDGRNDLFMPKGIYITQFRMTIHDRWGRILFITEDPEIGWDGTTNGIPMPEGVYVWQAAFTHDYGDNIQRDLRLQGTVTLIR